MSNRYYSIFRSKSFHKRNVFKLIFNKNLFMSNQRLGRFLQSKMYFNNHHLGNLPTSHIMTRLFNALVWQNNVVGYQYFVCKQILSRCKNDFAENLVEK